MGKIFLGGAALGTEANPNLDGTESALTGLEVDGTKYKVQSGSSVTPNPSVAGTEPNLTALDVDGAVYKIDTGTEVVANPSGTGATDLTKLQVDSTVYNIPQGTDVVANPTLAGTEAALTGIEVDGTKYKVPNDYLPLSGGTLSGQVTFSSNNIIATSGDNKVISVSSSAGSVILGDTSRSGNLLLRTGNNLNVVHQTDQGNYTVLDAANTQANPTLLGSEAELTSLKVSGTNYKIPQGTEVAANPTLAGTEAALTGLEVDGTKYKVNQPINVEANPTGTGSENLTKIEVDNTIYNIPQGTTVVANPSSTASADLTKLQVGSDVYSVSSGSAVTANVPLQGNEPTLKSLSIDSQSYAINGLLYSSTAPTAANTDGTIKIALLESEPAVKYDGWIYIIVVTYNITSNITNGTTTGATKIKENGTASVTIVPNSGYDLPSAVTVTGASYTYDSTTGEVVLSNPTGAVTIEATCTAKNYIITAAITNGTDSGSTTIQTGGTASVTITPWTGYNLPSSVTVTGASYTYNNTTGIVSLSNPTDNVLITATCPVQTFTITTNVTNGTAGGATSIAYGDTAQVTITPNSGYALSSSITVSGVGAYVWENGVVSLSNPTENITITAVCKQAYTVTVTGATPPSGSNFVSFSVYDGNGTGGTLRGEVSSAGIPTAFSISSGYITLSDGAFSGYTRSGGVTYVKDIDTGYVFSVTGAGTITASSYNTPCFLAGTQITLADGTTKNVEDVTYDDDLLVWNLYEGKLDSAKPTWIMVPGIAAVYKKVTLSDGTVLKLAGPDEKSHRLFNVTKQKFLYANECVGDEVYKQDGTIVKVVSYEIINEHVNYYNLITDKYYNCFANGVLTGQMLNNTYRIENMKYDTSERLISEQEEADKWVKIRAMQKERETE